MFNQELLSIRTLLNGARWETCLRDGGTAEMPVEEKFLVVGSLLNKNTPIPSDYLESGYMNHYIFTAIVKEDDGTKLFYDMHGNRVGIAHWLDLSGIPYAQDCPCCDSQRVVVAHDNLYYVRCNNCFMSGPRRSGMIESIISWNSIAVIE